MKNIVICLFFVIIGLDGFCQIENKQQKIYFWEITSVGGANMDPEVMPEKKPNIHYIAYMEAKPNVKIENVSFWLKNGLVFNAALQTNTSLPIKFENELIVPKTKNTVFTCNLNAIETLVLPLKIKRLLNSNELVVVYSINKVKYYSINKTIMKRTQNLP